MVPTLREQTVHLENNLNKMLPFVLLNLIIQQHGEVGSIKISRTQTGWETGGVSCPKSHTKSSPEMKLEPRLVTLRGGLVPRFSGTCSRKPQCPPGPRLTLNLPPKGALSGLILFPVSHPRVSFLLREACQTGISEHRCLSVPVTGPENEWEIAGGAGTTGR